MDPDVFLSVSYSIFFTDVLRRFISPEELIRVRKNLLHIKIRHFAKLHIIIHDDKAAV